MSLKAKSKLAEIRKKAGLTQAQLAVLIGVTTNTIQNWEKEDGLTQLEKYLKLGAIFGIHNLRDLFEYVEVPDGNPQKQKEFSLESLEELSKNWGIKVKDTEIEFNPNEEQEDKTLEELQTLVGTQEPVEITDENENFSSSKFRRDNL